jgi:hypothetical protein
LAASIATSQPNLRATITSGNALIRFSSSVNSRGAVAVAAEEEEEDDDEAEEAEDFESGSDGLGDRERERDDSFESGDCDRERFCFAGADDGAIAVIVSLPFRRRFAGTGLGGG